ncbi:HlyD family type I secretion periplasmic adaptor subunit [Altericroceibacterium endophyticum]|uniref:Membrane fusion protein (MFP) family protein n=1 Tax=Altericroceibacterium endophyticum TaxID=1808508 RepID=A0A6I4T622_9SPHN|nr:HlyD family type I secretion periplasmic adaptor subunit [Altericroceibacterium endophyticum]MXO66644.1 HlyD family type I secretion periplasmic adaptor subunit [Altericroceibacterium endophyticum]
MQAILEDTWLKRALIACGCALGLFLLWGALAPLAEGVTAFGKVTSDTDRRVVQHLEGGIIEDILVREGDIVQAGQTLMVLRDVSAVSGRDQVAIDYADISATIARLLALSGKSDSFKPDGIEFGMIDAATIDEIIRRQTQLFEQQKRKLSADISVLAARRAGLQQTVRNSETEINSSLRQLEIVRRELADKRDLLAEQLIPADEVIRLERDEARLSAEIGRLTTARQSDAAQVQELGEQIAQIQAKFDEEIAQQLVEARAKSSEFAQKLTAMEDVVDRSMIVAPTSGTILNLAYTTTGGVVRAGEPILEIVPNNDELLATVEIRPSDIENVYSGLKVRTRFSGLASWDTPSLAGEVAQVSADLKTSPSGDYSFYEARIRMSASELAQMDSSVIPGMPVEAFIASGHTRTLIDYLLEPLTATIRRGARS